MAVLDQGDELRFAGRSHVGRTATENIAYRRTAVEAMLSVEPRLKEMRFVDPRPRLGPVATAARVARGAGCLGCIGVPVVMAHWFATRVLRFDASSEALFFAAAPNQPRPLRVVNTFHLKQERMDLTLTVSGWAPRCILKWGNEQLFTGNHWSPETLAAVVSGILDDRIVLVRTSQTHEHGMGGQWYHTLHDRMFDLASRAFLSNHDSLTHCCEAAAYSWSGARDMRVVEKRCHLAKAPYHSHTDPAVVTLPE